jgi:hypothetical protein
MSCTANDFTLNEDYLDTFASCRTSCSMAGGTTTDNDQFLVHIHVVEVTAKVVVVLDVVVELDEVVVEVEEVVVEVDVVVVAPKVGKVVDGTATLLGQKRDG